MNGLDFLSKPQKPHFWEFLGPPDLLRLFFKVETLSLFFFYDYLTSSKKLEKTDMSIEILLCKWTDRQTEGRKDRQMEGQTNRVKLIHHFCLRMHSGNQYEHIIKEKSYCFKLLLALAQFHQTC